MSELFGDQTETPKLEDLVGEGKKYRDNDALVKAIFEKDNFINQLQNENSEFRTELRARTNLEELADRLASPKTPEEHRQEPEPKPSKDTNQTDIKTLVQQLLNEEKTKTSRETNVAKAKEGLKERFGNDYEATLKELASDLGVSEKFLNDLAGTSPSGLLKMVDSIKKPEGDHRPSAPPRGMSFSGDQPNTKKNKAYYDDLRKKDLNLYMSARVQNEMYKEAMRQGADFYN